MIFHFLGPKNVTYGKDQKLTARTYKLYFIFIFYIFRFFLGPKNATYGKDEKVPARTSIQVQKDLEIGRAHV